MALACLALFDLDGTLVRGTGAGRRAILRAWESTFGRRVQFEPRWAAGRTDTGIFLELARQDGVPPQCLDARARDLVASYLDALEDEVRKAPGDVLPGVRELLVCLEGSGGWSLALGTGNLERGARIKLAPFDLNRHFPVGGFGDDGPARHDVLRAACRRAAAARGAPFDGVVVIGDTPLDVESGHQIGARVVAVATGPYTAGELEAAGADAVVSDLGSVGRIQQVLEETALGGSH